MYLAVDVGGTKTLLACFSAGGELLQKTKFATPEDYEKWLDELTSALPRLKCDDWLAGTLAIPGQVNRERGIGIAFGNLPWKQVPIQADVERLAHCPMIVENDAKVGGLAEAKLIKKDFKSVLYITIGTGVGVAHIMDGVIDLNVNDRGGNGIMLSHKGKRQSWDSFASGRAIVRRYGKKAGEISDPETWRLLSKDFALGILELLAKYEPDVVVIGGGVGSHFSRFGKFLESELKKYETPLMSIPPLRPAKHSEEAVIYGCYELAKARYGSPVKAPA